MKTRIRLASDVGGTFTDIVKCTTDSLSGEILGLDSLKVDTTPGDFERGILEGIRRSEAPLAQVEAILHGATVVINALTERKGAKTALITTQGFRDVLEIARGNRPDLFNLQYQKPTPFVPRYLRREITERIDHSGNILSAPQLDQLPGIVADFRREGVEAIAVCFLHAYINPDNEQAVVSELQKLWPEIAISASHEVARQWREYERTNTTVLNAYVRPITTKYLQQLEDALGDDGFAGSAYVMQSNAGVTTFATAKRTPISLVESGPACGMLAAAAIGRSIGTLNVLALDIGGTTAKCALIENGQVQIDTNYFIERSERSAGYPILTPVVDIVEIGNGGGSIAWIDVAGRMQVGPKSMGANPGPVAYGRQSDNVTTTDANLLLRRLDPDLLSGGNNAVNMDAVQAAFEKLGQPLGLDANAAARGVIRIANHNMTKALKLVSVSRGYDPRDFALAAFGGGGPMHATALATELRIPRVIIPVFSPVFSALGMLMSDVRQDFRMDRVLPLRPGVISEIEKSVATLQQLASDRLEEDGVARGQMRFESLIRMRYAGQDHAVEFPMTANGADMLQALQDDFAREYEKRYSYTLDKPLEVIGFHLIGIGEVPKIHFPELPASQDVASALKGQRTVDFDVGGIQLAKIYDRAKLRPGMTFQGPAVIEEVGSATLVLPGNQVSLDRFGNIYIEID
jgi:N-methylhydantoinase A